MLQAIAIASGGAIGALMRFYATQAITIWLGKGFPYGTLFINVSGSLLMGLLYVVLTERLQISTELRAALLVGVIGAFTTFSTFSMETLKLLQDGALIKAGLNILLSVVLCIGAAWLGVILARQ